MRNPSLEHRFVDVRQVLSAGACIGCGGCVLVARGQHFTMRFTELQMYQAQPPDWFLPEDPLFERICPFSGRSMDEDDLGRQHFGDSLRYVGGLGYCGDLYAGHVKEGDFRTMGSSGGLVTWLLTTCVKEGIADHIIHVGPNPAQGLQTPLYTYKISSSDQEVQNNSGSIYYVVEFSEVLRRVRECEGKYLFVGLPCMVKAVRLLQRVDGLLSKRILHLVGLVCGHLKSGALAEYYGWAQGIPPSELASMDFRVKQAHSTANDYRIEARSKTGAIACKPSRELLGGDWGLGFFKPSACDLCDDVFAETADITIGDAWLKPYLNDPGGNNIVVCRDSALAQLIDTGIQRGALNLDRISPDAALKSQTSGLRHRREGLSHRLHLKKERGEWFPQKRVQPASVRVSRRRERIYELRSAMAERSHAAFAEAKANGSLKVFYRQMKPLVQQYTKLYKRDTRGPLWMRAFRLGLGKVRQWFDHSTK